MILEDNIQAQLRNSNVITVDEVAMRIGDLHVAENVLTKERRMINLPGTSNNISESNESKGLLKG